ncbi:hypothetical protein [Clostridium cagae]|uniref:hypothetical protein n=1 Tax=Clostridium cagae TaxID=2080751 RepID=UPI0018F8A214|nr:hypothetical protein [Clostridium cagae]
MSFFNSVVSAVVGAVAAVANAVVSAAKSIVSAVSGKGSQDAGGMTALGAMATIADVFEDGEIDEDEEELLVEAFKLLVGAFIFPFGSGSSSAEIDSNENTCKNEPTLWSKTCNLGAGVLDGAKGTLDGLANMVKHPIDTINSARSFAENPQYAARVGKAIWKEIKDEYKRDVIDGDANSESYFTGKALFEAALLFGPTVTKLNKSEKIAKTSEVISEAEKVSKESEVISEVEKITEGITQAKFKYKNNPMDNLKASKDIIENSDAVYGFSPKKGGRLDDFVDMIDWNDAEQVASARAQRIAYHNKMSTNLESKVKKLLDEGYSMEDIAKNMINERNQNRINTYIKNGNYEGLEGMYKSNLKEYGNAEGPTYEYMLKKCGANEEIINSSIKSNLGMDACTGLYDEYFKGGN